MTLRRLLIFASFCSFAASMAAQTPVSSAPPKGYLIGPGDVLTVKALGEKDFEAEGITVDEDGKVVLPWINDPVSAQCKTERELQNDVIKLWSQFLKNPQISVHVTQRNSRPPISVTGEVASQNQFNPQRRVRLLEVLSLAGGPTPKNGGVVRVVRVRPPMCAEASVVEDWKRSTVDGLGASTRIYSLAAVAQGSNEANPEILPGDIINVPKAAPVYVTGEVKKSGEFDLPATGLPLTQAIAMANGGTREAKIKAIKIYRRKLGASQPEVLVANLVAINLGQEKDIMLEPFDIVEVGKARKSFGTIMMETLTGLPARIPIPIP